jgi:hypothetical protein
MNLLTTKKQLSGLQLSLEVEQNTNKQLREEIE